MDPLTPAPRRFWTKQRLVAAAILAVVGVALGLGLRQSGLLEALDAVVLALRDAGPLVFFVAMAVLPAAGFPLLAFTLSAGPVFGPTLGPGWVVVCSLTAVVVNLLLSYWLAHRALRPLVTRLLAWIGFPLPAEKTAGAWQLTLIVRLAPGPPFWAQSYLLGLLRVPLVPYLVVSTTVTAGYIVALVYGGTAITEGNGGMAVAAAGLLVLAIAVLQWLRQRALRKRVAADPALIAVQPLPTK